MVRLYNTFSGIDIALKYTQYMWSNNAIDFCNYVIECIPHICSSKCIHSNLNDILNICDNSVKLAFFINNRWGTFLLSMKVREWRTKIMERIYECHAHSSYILFFVYFCVNSL